MPVSFLSNDQRENHGRFAGPPSAHDLARYFHLNDADHALIAQKRGAHNRLGFAVQLGTVRYLGTFLEDPLAVPQPVLRTLAKQLRIAALDKASAYSAGEQRWQHATEIRASYGYVEFTEPLIAFRLTRWLYALLLDRHRPAKRAVRAGHNMTGDAQGAAARLHDARTVCRAPAQPRRGALVALAW